MPEIPDAERAVVKITADSTHFELMIERTLTVHFVHAVREIAYIKGMTAGQRAAFGDTELLRRIDQVFPQSVEELHAAANLLEQDLGDRPDQKGLDL